MTARFTPSADGTEIEGYDAADNLFFTTAWLTAATIPDLEVTLSGQLIDFGDIAKDNALATQRAPWDTPNGSGGYNSGGEEFWDGYITAVPGETSYADIALGTVPAAADFFRIRAKLTRTTSPTAPTAANMMTGALDPIPPMGQYFTAHDNFIPLEQANPIARTLEFLNDAGTLKLRRIQSIGMDNLADDTYGGWAYQNNELNFASTTTGTAFIQAGIVVWPLAFTYGTTKGQPIYYLGGGNSGTTEGKTGYTHQRGGANQMSLADPTNFRSVYSLDAVIEPGYFKTDPVLGPPTQKTTLRAAYLYGTTASGSTTTYAAVAIGIAAASRLVLVMIGAGVNTASEASVPTAVTIGGVTATKLAGADPSTYASASIWIASVPTGTTVNIVITWPTTDAHMSSVLVYSLYNFISATPHNTGSVTADGTESTNPSFNLTTAAGGFAFVAAIHVDGVVPSSPPGQGNLLSGISNPGYHALQIIGHPFFSTPFCVEMGMQGTNGTTLDILMAGEAGRAIAIAGVSLT